MWTESSLAVVEWILVHYLNYQKNFRCSSDSEAKDWVLVEYLEDLMWKHVFKSSSMFVFLRRGVVTPPLQSRSHRQTGNGYDNIEYMSLQYYMHSDMFGRLKYLNTLLTHSKELTGFMLDTWLIPMNSVWLWSDFQAQHRYIFINLSY